MEVRECKEKGDKREAGAKLRDMYAVITRAGFTPHVQPPEHYLQGAAAMHEMQLSILKTYIGFGTAASQEDSSKIRLLHKPYAHMNHNWPVQRREDILQKCHYYRHSWAPLCVSKELRSTV